MACRSRRECRRHCRVGWHLCTFFRFCYCYQSIEVTKQKGECGNEVRKKVYVLENLAMLTQRIFRCSMKTSYPDSAFHYL